MFFSIYSSEENITAQITVIEKQLDSTDISIMLAGVLSLCRKQFTIFLNFPHLGGNLVDVVDLLGLVIFKCLNLGGSLTGILLLCNTSLSSFIPCIWLSTWQPTGNIF